MRWSVHEGTARMNEKQTNKEKPKFVVFCPLSFQLSKQFQDFTQNSFMLDGAKLGRS
jgi:hypothetical protein